MDGMDARMWGASLADKRKETERLCMYVRYKD